MSMSLSAYELIKEKDVKDLNSIGYLFQHKKSGARIFVLSNEEENKVFSIGFRTPPEDSTGLPHILEHSVLCGSKNFPAKDPFVELVKGSLNTFLNAMTYPDKTLYPVASCNDKDFQNLMHVYMDAVFCTNIYDREEIFRQEGWHYDLESPEAELKINGVVYNEMKGAFSSPEEVLAREIFNSLFPDTAYRHESGGNPENIPELSYQQFLDFHSKYYHPSNSYIYLYGNMDIEEKLKWLDEQYLGQYDRIEIDSEIKVQKPFDKMIEVEKEYSISMNELEENNTYLSYNIVAGSCLDKNLYVAFEVLEYALLGAPGAPLKQALLDAKIGKDIMGSYDNGILQPYFSIIAKNTNISEKERFLQIIKDVLEKQAKGGLNKKALLAALNHFEFKYREADFGGYPKGLMYGLQSFDSWLYDNADPFMHIEANDTFAWLRDQIETPYFENLIEEYLLENAHASVVVIKPKQGLTAKMDQQLSEELAAYKKSLSKEEIERLVADTIHLEEYQEEPSTKEELEMIPLLKRTDIKREAMDFSNKEVKVGDTLVLHHDLFTSGIGYLNLLFDVKRVPTELIPYIGILKGVLGYVDTKKYSYSELFNEINIHTGGIVNGIGNYTNLENRKEFETTFEIRVKVLYEKLPLAFRMIEEILTNSSFEDEKRLYEIIAQGKSRLQMNMNSSGHSVSLMRAMSYYSESAQFTDRTSGIGFYREIDRIETSFETEKASLIQNLQSLMNYIFRSENLLVSYTANEEGFAYLEKELVQLKKVLYHDDILGKPFSLECEKKNEGFKTASKVQYVSRTGNFIEGGFEYKGTLKILKVILSYDYLWQNIRVKGGAYGCMSGFSRTGDGYFTSYRDPNLKKTNEVYEKMPAYIRSFAADNRDMTKYIIGTISDVDTPLTPSLKGERSTSAYLTHLCFEQVQKERDEILDAQIEDIQALAAYVSSILDQGNICVIGNEAKLEEQKELFYQLENLN